MSNAKYFHISTGLRGCYMPDNAAIIECDSINYLRDCVAYECVVYRDAGFVGGSKRAIDIVTRDAWNKPAYLPYCVPLAPRYSRDSSGQYNYSYGVFIAPATGLEFAEYMAECNGDYPESESELSERFDSEIAPLVIEHYGESDIVAIHTAFNAWTDVLCKDGELHPAQYDSYCYVGKWSN